MTELYREMRDRFEKLERAHFERTAPGAKSFVLKAFPEKSAELKREWVEKLKEQVGPTRGELLARSIEAEISSHHLMKNRAEFERMINQDRPMDRGRSWLHRGTAETQLNVTTGEGRDGRPTLSIHFKTGGEDGERGSGSTRNGQAPKRWQHLLPPDVLGVPSAL